MNKHAIKLAALWVTVFGLSACAVMMTEQARATKRAELIKQVLASVEYDNDPLQATLLVKDASGTEKRVYRAMKSGTVTGVAYEINEVGYEDDIRLVMGVDTVGRVLGVRSLEQHETWGKGDKIELGASYWILGFSGRSLENPPLEKWKVRKSGGHFDEIAGATTTCRSVVDAVRQGLLFFAANKARLTESN